MKIREDLVPGAPVPDITCLDHDSVERRLSHLAGGWPTILVFWRGRY